jgi:hypothetical protein
MVAPGNVLEQIFPGAGSPSGGGDDQPRGLADGPTQRVELMQHRSIDSQVGRFKIGDEQIRCPLVIPGEGGARRHLQPGRCIRRAALEAATIRLLPSKEARPARPYHREGAQQVIACHERRQAWQPPQQVGPAQAETADQGR